MAVFKLKTFKDIQDAVREELKIQSSDTESLNRIKRNIQDVYINEVVPYASWKWLREEIDLNLPSKVNTGTATATLGSKTITLTDAPTLSKRGHFINIGSRSEIYTIAQHSAGSVTVTLEANYVGPSASELSYQIWTDTVVLPSNTRETYRVSGDIKETPLENRGWRAFKNEVQILPLEEGTPRVYTTTDYIDPDPYSAIAGLPALTTRESNGLVKTLTYAADVSSLIQVSDRVEVQGSASQTYNGQFVVSSVTTAVVTYTGTEALNESPVADGALSIESLNNQGNSERYRELRVHPSINSSTDPQLLHVDYIREAEDLEADNDEPLMPIEDRVVLKYGALSMSWSRERNPEEAARNSQMYDRKLQKMQGKLDDSTDHAMLVPSKTYLAVKRNTLRRPFNFRRVT